MAAGLGFKNFASGEVLTAADVNAYLNSQTVMVFADAAARTAAITSPQEGMFSYLKDTNATQYYTGSAWTNLDTTGMVNPMTTTGDTIYSSSGTTPARLGIGTTGQVLTVAGGLPSWATPAGGGSGLTFITGSTFSAVSSVSLPNSTFSSTYLNYKIYFNITSAASPITETRIRLRASGSDNTTNNYYSGGYELNSGGGGGGSSTDAQSYVLWGNISVGTAQNTQMEITMYSPQTESTTTFNVNGSKGTNTWKAMTGFYLPTTAFDAMTFYADAGTISGSYRVFGIANS